ncbi:hypothetical protein [Desertifilum sp. FACHB-866]|nr:hypothetical protein [Desertifilum sp. FACHB-866]
MGCLKEILMLILLDRPEKIGQLKNAGDRANQYRSLAGVMSPV